MILNYIKDLLALIFMVSISFLFSCKSNHNEGVKNEGGKDEVVINDGVKKDNNEIFDIQSFTKHMEILSSDEYEGRMPCSAGEDKTIAYIKEELESMKIDPGNGTSYYQDVPLIEIEGTSDSVMILDYGDRKKEVSFGKDFVIHSERNAASVKLKDSELVFCGFGIVAPEKNWNDFEGVDLKGKTAVVLVNDPGFGGEDPTFFKGDTMTYYGRWSYKYEEADRQGADGLLIIHEKTSAGYPWFVVQSSWTGPMQGLSGTDRSNDCGIKGWVSLNTAQDLFSDAGLDMAQEIRAARRSGFKPKSLRAKVSVNLENRFEECTSKNVVGLLKGSKRPDEYVVYTAHWDHIGIGPIVEGDSIYNGALDNASGTAAVLEIARAFTQQEPAPERSVIFLFVTAEEQGLWGSNHYVNNPLFPIKKTVANINLDGVNPAGKMKDFTITGKGHSEMDDLAALVAKTQGRYILAGQEPEKGYFYRSDHFNFVKVGVPALYGDGGYDHWDKGKEFAKEFKEGYTAKRYHAPSDEFVASEWNYEGFLQDGQLYYEVGRLLTNSDLWPKWKKGSEFSR